MVIAEGGRESAFAAQRQLRSRPDQRGLFPGSTGLIYGNGSFWFNLNQAR